MLQVFIISARFVLISTEGDADDLLKCLLYTVASSNLHFRTMRKHGVFVPEPDRSIVLYSGHEMCEAGQCLCKGLLMLLYVALQTK